MLLKERKIAENWPVSSSWPSYYITYESEAECIWQIFDVRSTTHIYEKLDESLTFLIFFNVTIVISIGKNCMSINIENSFKATFPRSFVLIQGMSTESTLSKNLSLGNSGQQQNRGNFANTFLQFAGLNLASLKTVSVLCISHVMLFWQYDLIISATEHFNTFSHNSLVKQIKTESYKN